MAGIFRALLQHKLRQERHVYSNRVTKSNPKLHRSAMSLRWAPSGLPLGSFRKRAMPLLAELGIPGFAVVEKVRCAARPHRGCKVIYTSAGFGYICFLK